MHSLSIETIWLQCLLHHEGTGWIIHFMDCLQIFLFVVELILFYRVSILDIKTGSVVSRVFNWKSFRAVTLQEGLLALRESTLDNLLMFDLADFLDRSREVESLACR